MPSTLFGEHLKRERELRGVSLEEIAAATRIKTSFLEALENGRWEELPGGAFNRGFIRATARFLGLDEDGMIAEYGIETGGESEAKNASESSGAMPRNYRPAIVAGAAILLALIAGIWLVRHEIYAHRQKRAAALAASAEGSPAVGTPAPALGTDANGTASSGAGSAGSSAAPTSATDPSMSQPAESPAATPGAAPAAPTSPPAPVENAASEPLKLRLETTKTVEIRVQGDGKTLFKGKLHSDDPKNFQARDGFEVSANDAAVVKLQLDGQDIAFGGKPGKRGSISLSRKDLKGTADAAH